MCRQSRAFGAYDHLLVRGFIFFNIKFGVGSFSNPDYLHRLRAKRRLFPFAQTRGLMLIIKIKNAGVSVHLN